MDGPFDPNCLFSTLDTVEEARFRNEPLPAKESKAVLAWLNQQINLKTGYRQTMCAPAKGDWDNPVRLFTGEELKSRAQILHILGEEAYRARLLLSRWIRDSSNDDALHLGSLNTEWFGPEFTGRYCCGQCSVSVWRALAAGGYPNLPNALDRSMENLRSRRDSMGRWKGVPFYYTLLVLTELNTASSLEELAYSGTACRQSLRRISSLPEPYASRRADLLKRAVLMSKG